MTFMGWRPEEAAAFLKMQFDLQYRDYSANHPDASWFIVYMDGAPAGRLIFQRSDSFIRIILLELLPDFRSKGCCTFVLNSFKTEAEKRKIPVRLNVALNNVRARRLFEALGFVEIGSDGVYCSMEWVAAEKRGRPARKAPCPAASPQPPIITDGAEFTLQY